MAADVWSTMHAHTRPPRCYGRGRRESVVPSHIALQHTAFPTGLLRGALVRLGLRGVAVAEITSLTRCKWIGALDAEASHGIEEPSPAD
jgi:hypothetical protein